jgi:DNA-binding NarL/FixJ family response regulator
MNRWNLTNTELNIVRLIGTKGLTNAQIAAELGTNVEKTIKTHMGNIFRKMVVRNRVQVALEWNNVLTRDE